MGPLEEIELRRPAISPATASEMGVRFNVARTVDQAYAVGREGNVLDRLSERLRASFGGATIAARHRLPAGEGQGRGAGDRLAGKPPPREAGVRIYGSEVEVRRSRDGYELNPAATMTSVEDAIDDMSGKARLEGDVLDPASRPPRPRRRRKGPRGPLRAARDQTPRARAGRSIAGGAGLRPRRHQAGRQDRRQPQPRPPGGASPTSTTTSRSSPSTPATTSTPTATSSSSPSHEGRRVEGEKLLDAIRGRHLRRQARVPGADAVDKPHYTTAALEAKKPTELLGSYRTNYTATTDQAQTRVENLKIASGAISGTFLAPGEVFSMIEHVPASTTTRRTSSSTARRPRLGRRSLPGDLHAVQCGTLRRSRGGGAHPHDSQLPT